MQRVFHYLFQPTQALSVAAQSVDEYVIRPSVWRAIEHDRTGRDIPRREVEGSFWNVFLAQLYYEDPETEFQQSFRESCLDLGFSGCWTVTEIWSGGEVTDLLEENVDRAAPFLAAQASLLGSKN
jgi:hypothetical protein